MRASRADIMLVGSIPGESVENVFRMCATQLGESVLALPDGELNERSTWVMFLAWRVFQNHMDIITVSKPDLEPGKANQVTADYHGPGWIFKLKPGIQTIRFDSLGYAEHAKSSYRKFCEMRAAGDIPSGMRFQVCLPLTESAFRWFFPNEQDFGILSSALKDALARELEEITSHIPADDLTIQWDVCEEVLAIEANDYTGQPPFTYDAPGDPFDRYKVDVVSLGERVPQDVIMGLHLCYGDLGHRHLMEPRDLATCVRMANAAVAVMNRSINYFHMPVPRDRNDDDYFAPLRRLETADARVFLGLVHHTDGLDGSIGRIRTASKYIDDFGIATECGFGRRPVSQVPELLGIHKEIVNAIGRP